MPTKLYRSGRYLPKLQRRSAWFPQSAFAFRLWHGSNPGLRTLLDRGRWNCGADLVSGPAFGLFNEIPERVHKDIVRSRPLVPFDPAGFTDPPDGCSVFANYCRLFQTNEGSQITALGAPHRCGEHAGAITFPDTDLRGFDPIRIVSAVFVKERYYACLIGRDILRNWTIVFDGRNKRVRIED